MSHSPPPPGDSDDAGPVNPDLAVVPNPNLIWMPALFSPTPNDRGSFGRDIATGNYPLRWDSWAQFQTWLRSEARSKSIELVRKNIRTAAAGLGWLERHEFVCARQGSGGSTQVASKGLDRKRTIPNKRVGCPCRLTVKTYPNTVEVLGMYTETHSHEIGNENIKFTRISVETKAWIAHLLSLGVENQAIVSLLPLPDFLPNMELRSRIYAKNKRMAQGR
jgi:hypothetical protein